jgi:DNA-binding transcriptional ArsR family regulator
MGLAQRPRVAITYNQMVVGTAGRHQDEQRRADRLFHALADPTRRDIVARAMADPASVSTIARRYPMSFAAVQKHVAVLEAAGLVTKQRQGREQLVHASPDTLRRAHRFLDDLEDRWRRRLDRFGQVLDQDVAKDQDQQRQQGDPQR